MKKRINVHNVLQSEIVVLGADEVPLITDKIDRLANYLDKTPTPVLRDIASENLGFVLVWAVALAVILKLACV